MCTLELKFVLKKKKKCYDAKKCQLITSSILENVLIYV